VNNKIDDVEDEDFDENIKKEIEKLSFTKLC
jgi:hypothetical protein